jgi:hypothetical protein
MEALVHSAPSRDDQRAAGVGRKDLKVWPAGCAGGLDADIRSGVDQNDFLAVSGDAQGEAHGPARRRHGALPAEETQHPGYMRTHDWSVPACNRRARKARPTNSRASACATAALLRHPSPFGDIKIFPLRLEFDRRSGHSSHQ